MNAYSDVFLSSPKIKLNAQNQRVIEFRIENERINDGDIVLNEYKTNNPINESFIEYLKITDLFQNDDYVDVSRKFNDKFGNLINSTN